MSRFSHSLIPLSLMCNAPNSVSAQWRSAGLIKTDSSWHIPGLTKDADLDHDPKMHFCALHLQRSICLELIPPAPRGLTATALEHRAGNSSTMSSWCPTASEGKAKKRVEGKVVFSHLWAVLESFCPRDRGGLWSSHPQRNRSLAGVSPPSAISTPAQVTVPRGETMGPLFIAIPSADVVLCHHFRPCQDCRVE